MDFGVTTAQAGVIKTGTGYEAKTITVDASQYYWQADLTGIKFSDQEYDKWGFTD